MRQKITSKAAIPLNALQNAYVHGRSKAFALGGRAAFVYLELAFERRLELAAFQTAWLVAMRSHPDFSSRPAALTSGQWVMISDPQLVTTPALVDLAATQNFETLAANIRRQVCSNRLSLAEYRPVDGTLVLGKKCSRLCLRIDLIACGAEGINAFLLALAVAMQSTESEISGARHSRCAPTLLNDEEPPAIPTDLLRSLQRPEFPLSRTDVKGVWTGGGAEINAVDTVRLGELARACDLQLEELLALAYCEIASHWSSTKEFGYPILLPQSMAASGGNASQLSVLPFAIHSEEGRRTSIRSRWSAAKRRWDELRPISGHRLLRELSKRSGGADGSPIPFALSLNLDRSHDFWNAAEQLNASVAHLAIETPFVLHDAQIFSKAGGLFIHYDAYCDAFEPGVPDALLGHFAKFLQDLASHPDILDNAGYESIPQGQAATRDLVNQCHQSIADDELLQTGFYRQAALRPNHPAVITADGTMTYGELERRANGLGEELKQLGTKPGELVAVLMHKGWEQVVATIAVMETGAAYLPLSPTLPADRITQLLDVCCVRTVLSQSDVCTKNLVGSGRRVIAVDQLAVKDAVRHLPGANQTDLAYVIFTSGSTGTPKGVMIDHRGALNTIIDINERFQLGPDDRCLAISNLNFDLSVFDIFGLLRAGGTVIMPNEADNSDPRHWLAMADEHRATLWNSVPAIFSLALARLERFRETMPRSLRLIMLSGDWIPLDLPPRTWQLAPRLKIVALGGATEASIWSNYYEIDHVDPKWASIPYGRPLKNQSFAVRDANGQNCPDYVAGELYIGGLGVAQGYWEDPERTDLAFVHDVDGKRLYRTGDLGRYLPDGTLEFLGRRDNQVKVNGYRVELGEIEAKLAAIEGIHQAVVACQGERFGTKSLVAFVQADMSETLARPQFERQLEEHLKGRLRSCLPPYMIPSIIKPLDKIPLSANGKVDRRQLPDLAQAPAAAVFCSGDPVADDLTTIYADILRTPDIDINTSFFQLGGDSLGAIEVLSRIELAFGAAMSMSQLLRDSSVCGVAQHLRQNKMFAATPSLSASAHQQRSIELARLDDGRSEGPVLVMLHPVGGQVACYRHLIEALGNKFRIYGLAIRSAAADDHPDAIETMADLYCDLLATENIQPDMLIGWSFGGFLAYAMSQRLQTSRPCLIIDALPSVATPEEWSAARLRNAFFHDLSENGRLAIKKSSNVRLEEFFHVYSRNMLALAHYAPKPTAVPILLASAAENLLAVTDFWNRISKPVAAALSLAGDHFDAIKPPNAQKLARILESLFQQEERRRYGHQ